MKQKVRDRFLVFGTPLIEQPEIDEAVDSLRAGWLGTGPKVTKFEETFRQYIGAEFAAAVPRFRLLPCSRSFKSWLTS